MFSLWLPEPLLRAVILPVLLAGCSGLGWLALSPIGKRLGQDWLERWVLYWLAGIVIVSWVGVLLAFLGLFKIWLVVPLLVAAGVLIRRTVSGTAPETSDDQAKAASEPDQGLGRGAAVANVLVVLLLVLAGWLYARPAESFLLTDDSAVYSIAGIVLARDGTLYFEPDEVYRFSDDTLTSEHPPAACSFTYQFSFLQSSGPVLTRHTGPFYPWPLENGRIEIGFLALPKVWAAMCVWLASPAYAGWAVPFLALAGLALLYVLARRAFSWRVALAATALLMVSFPQFWFARFPLSEMHTQVVLLGGLFAVQRIGTRTDQRTIWVLGVLSGASLGLLGCLRFESPLLMVVLLPLLYVLLARHPRAKLVRLALLGTAVAAWLFALGGSLITSPFYFLTRSLTVISPRLVQLVLGATVVVAGAILLIWRAERRAPGRLAAVNLLAERLLTPCINALWAIWLILATAALTGLDGRETLIGWLADYWGLVPLLLAMLGVTAIICARQTRPEFLSGIAPLMGITAVFLLVYSIHPMVNIVHPWAIRRTAAFIGPMIALLIASLPESVVALARSFGQPPAWLTRVLAGVGWLGVALAIAIVGQVSYPFLRHTEREGTWQGLQSLDQALPEDAVLLLADSQVDKWLGPAMEMVFDHPSFPLRNTWTLDPDSPVVDHLITSALEQGRAIYFVHADSTPSWRATSWNLQSKGMVQFTTAVVPGGLSVPNGESTSQQSFALDLYQVTAVDAARAPAATEVNTTHIVPIAAGSYPYLASGFHVLEQAGQDHFRWTHPSAEITLPWPGPKDQVIEELCIELDVSGWRPAGEPSPTVQVLIESQEVYSGVLEASLGRHVLSLNGLSVRNQDSDMLQIMIQSTAWTSPSEGANPDPRELGIMLFGATASTGELCPCAQSGLYALESDGGQASYHWTEPEAEISFPWPAESNASLDQLCLTLDLSAFRPAGIPSPEVSILAEGTLLYQNLLDSSQGRDQITVSGQDIVNSGRPELEIRIVTTPWRPSDGSESGDSRELGIMLYDISASADGSCP